MRQAFSGMLYEIFAFHPVSKDGSGKKGPDILMHIPTTINNQGLCGDKVAFIANEKNEGSNQIIWLLQPSQRCAAGIIFRNIIGNCP
jgi:hypothetical protein